MRIIPFCGLAWVVLLAAGCANHYDITTTNANVVRSRTRPVLNENGMYIYTDLANQQQMVNKMRVTKIEAVRRGSKQSSSF